MSTFTTKSLPLVCRLPSVAEKPTPQTAPAPPAAPSMPPLPSGPVGSALLTPGPLRHNQSPLDAVLRMSLEAASSSAVRQALLGRLADLWGAQRVALGWRRHGEGAWVTAVSGQGLLDARSELGRAFAAAAAETVLFREKRRWCGTDQPVPSVPVSYRQLASATGAMAITGVPLFKDKDEPGVALLILDSSGPELLGRDDEVVAVAGALAGLTKLCDEATPNLLTKLQRWAGGLAARERRIATLAGAAMLGMIGLMPVADRVSCPATLEPSLRRYVAAPFDGKLEKAVAKVGDTVAAGQALASFDRRPLEMELSTQAAQLEEAAKRRDSARAKGQAAQSQLAELELAQIQSKIDQCEQHLAELTVTSPIDGVIVRGQLDRVEGAPLSRGQNLFEVAPLSPLVAEVAIPEMEVGLVKPGQTVTIRPLATGQAIRGTIDRVHPRAEMVNGQTVFMAEVELDNADKRMMPGMQAQVVIYGGRRPLAWTLMRRPLSRVARWTWW